MHISQAPDYSWHVPEKVRLQKIGPSLTGMITNDGENLQDPRVLVTKKS